jgi:hypothetical protein
MAFATKRHPSPRSSKKTGLTSSRRDVAWPERIDRLVHVVDRNAVVPGNRFNRLTGPPARVHSRQRRPTAHEDRVAIGDARQDAKDRVRRDWHYEPGCPRIVVVEEDPCQVLANDIVEGRVP